MVDHAATTPQPDSEVAPLDEHAVIIATLKQIARPLAATLSHKTEVLVHDLTKVPNSIVAIHGDLTGRNVGGPATDLLLKHVADGTFDTREGYKTQLANGREMRSTTIAVRNSQGTPIAALCVNSDIEMWKELREFIGTFDEENTPPVESFVQDLDELSDLLINRAIEAQGIPIALMRKEHKLDVVKQVRTGGIFLLRDAAEIVAQRLGISRFTIYNYINEIEKQETQEQE
ncbi:helix-turn-helix transcriptional regulator [Timonella sp. A28]|uniref:helix-turn-helix transcriptional regulator n=1 Tax=Timonella sp. A28 TaxID=3442640 RepID=UPI003EBFAC7B